jgi:regulator of protease activity HflC (stomatin/prohibitin superfamily)
MGSSTKYNVTVNDEVVETKSKKANAVEFADNLRGENPDAVIEVRTEAGTVVHTVKATGTHAKPWTRTQDHDLDLEVPAGYTVAYTRTRVGALVARADDKSDWIVITQDGVTHVENTTQARETTNELAAAYKTRKAEEKAAADVAKAEAKEAKAKEREEKRAAKEQEKADKAAAKAAAKAEKEAAEAAAAEEQELQDACSVPTGEAPTRKGRGFALPAR